MLKSRKITYMIYCL